MHQRPAPHYRFTLIARIDGSSTRRRQRRFESDAKVQAAIGRWRARGFNTWWIYAIRADGHHTLKQQWIDEPQPQPARAPLPLDLMPNPYAADPATIERAAALIAEAIIRATSRQEPRR